MRRMVIRIVFAAVAWGILHSAQAQTASGTVRDRPKVAPVTNQLLQAGFRLSTEPDTFTNTMLLRDLKAFLGFETRDLLGGSHPFFLFQKGARCYVAKQNGLRFSDSNCIVLATIRLTPPPPPPEIPLIGHDGYTGPVAYDAPTTNALMDAGFKTNARGWYQREMPYEDAKALFRFKEEDLEMAASAPADGYFALHYTNAVFTIEPVNGIPAPGTGSIVNIQMVFFTPAKKTNHPERLKTQSESGKSAPQPDTN